MRPVGVVDVLAGAGVGHEAGAESSRPAGCSQAAAADPDRRAGLACRLLGGRGRHDDVVEAEVLALVGEPLAAPGQLEDLDGLVGTRATLALGHAEHGEFVRLVAGREPDVEAAAGQLVDHGQVLGQPQRVVQRGQQDRGAEAGRGGSHRQRAQRGAQRRQVALLAEVVLGQPDRGEAELFGAGGLVQGLPVQLRPGPAPPGRVAEVVPDAEPGHAATSISTLTSPVPRVISRSNPEFTADSSGTTELITRSAGSRPLATRPATRGKSWIG